MPIANSKQCTAMVALTAAPAKGLNQMPFANPIKCPIEVGVASEVRNGSNPRHTGSRVEIRLAGAPSTKCPIGMKIDDEKCHRSHEAPKCDEA